MSGMEKDSISTVWIRNKEKNLAENSAFDPQTIDYFLLSMNR